MKILEKILAIGLLTALVMKFTLVPGGDILALWMLTILAIMYYFLGFLFFNQLRLRGIFRKESYKGISTERVTIAIITGLALSIICIGSLFKLLDMPGADTMLITGLSISAMVLIIVVIRYRMEAGGEGLFIIKRIAVIGGFGLILALLPQVSIIKLQYRNHPRYVEAYINYLNDPRNDSLGRKKELEYYRMKLSEEQFRMYEKSINR